MKLTNSILRSILLTFNEIKNSTKEIIAEEIAQYDNINPKFTNITSLANNFIHKERTPSLKKNFDLCCSVSLLLTFNEVIKFYSSISFC